MIKYTKLFKCKIKYSQSIFFSLVIDETIKTMPSTLTSTGIRCFRKRCTGIISSEVDLDNNKIHWKCSKCRNSGTITGW